MKTMRVTIQDNLALGEVANMLNCISRLYRLLCLSEGREPICKSLVNQLHTHHEENLMNSSIESMLNAYLQEIPDLQLVGASQGSIILKFIEQAGSSTLGKLYIWLHKISDPHYNERVATQLEGEKLDNELKKREIEKKVLDNQKTEYLNDLEIASKKAALFKDAFEIHDGLTSRGFEKQIADLAFFETIKCIGAFQQIQNQNNALISVDIIDENE